MWLSFDKRAELDLRLTKLILDLPAIDVDILKNELVFRSSLKKFSLQNRNFRLNLESTFQFYLDQSNAVQGFLNKAGKEQFTMV